MAQFKTDDSDCIIEEQNITCISLDGSQNSDEKDLASGLAQDVEEGEVTETEEESIRMEVICEIKFLNRLRYDQFGPLIITCLKEKLNQQLGMVIDYMEESNQDCVKLIVKQSRNFIEEIPVPPMLEGTINVQADNQFEKETSPDLTGIKELFTIDTTPVPKIDSVKVPSYKRAVKDALLDGEAAARKKLADEESAFKIKRKNTCFNCGNSGHNIRECPKPHNAKRIKNAKRAYSKTERYHVDVEQRFAHLKPGCVSEKLREALGLRKGELPFFFYRMRVMGYPPGWLEDAKVEHSGINLFNSDGTKILHSDEDGEIDVINHKYNTTKIYDFPGFNKDPGENFFDDYKYHNVPPLDKNQMKEEFIKTLGDNVLKAYKRKKLKDFPNATHDDSYNRTIHEATDMEIEDPETTTLGEVQFTRPPPPTEQPPSPSPPPPPPASSPSSCESPVNVNESGERDFSTQSPSLMELEKKKQRLLQELQSNTTIIEIEDSLIDDIIELDEEDDKLNDQNSDSKKSFDNISVSTATSKSEDKAEENIVVIKESFMGTPVLKFSPYDNLPNGENFKVGVSDVINFENLPDSTGKYEQMKEVIMKVRNCIHKLHSED